MRSWRLLLPACALIALTLVLLSSGLFSTRNASANPLGGLVAMAAGEDHTCAITDTGGVKCWGTDFFSQDSLGFHSNRPVPAEIAGVSDVTAIGAGYNHACAVIADGTVSCWGNNVYGVLGGAGKGVITVRNLSGPAVAVTGGINHSCALLEGGTVECWGSNAYGQLGNSHAVCGLYVACDGADGAAADIDNATSIAAGQEHTCAVLSTGHVKCWGRNGFGQLGDGGAIDHAVPVEVLNIVDAVAVAAGSAHSCALTQSHGVLCWGNVYGNVPVAIPGLEGGIAGIAAAQSHTCVLTTAGGVKCWGDNGYGQLGDGKRCGGNCPAPVDVVGLQSGVAQIALGIYHTCAVLQDGTAKCWGLNDNGQLGNGTNAFLAYVSSPTDVVEAIVKPTPTPTPCALEGCPTATPRPAPPQTGLDFSLSIDANEDGIADCGTAAGQRPECDMALGAHFRAIVTLHALPPSTDRYFGFDTRFDFAGVTSEHKSDILWPDCGFPATFFATSYLAFGCATPLGDITSSFVGPLGQSLFTCSASGSVTLKQGHSNTDIVADNLAIKYEAPTGGEQLVINCGDVPHAGDVDCSSITNATDAALMLQRGADLVDWLSCPQFADVNLDRSEDAVDSLLTLQYIAGLVAGLPILPQGP